MYSNNENIIKKKQAGIWLRPAVIFVILIIITAVFSFWDLDRKIVGLFYSEQQGWFLKDRPLWRWLYKYGTIPGILLSLGALISWCVCAFDPRRKDWSRYFLVILLTTILGAGLMVNMVLKNYWGRPRPIQVADFGGRWEYHQVFEPGTPGKGKSFTCGHCTMGYLFITLFYLRRKAPKIAITGGLFGLLYGSLVGICRVVQGAHFPSDVIWSLGIIFMVSDICNEWLKRLKNRISFENTSHPARKKLVHGVVYLTAILIILGFLTRRPFFRVYDKALMLNPGTKELIIRTNVDFAGTKVIYTDQDAGRMEIQAQGFGFPNVSHICNIDILHDGNKYIISNIVEARGYYSELNHILAIYLPESFRDAVHVNMETSP